MNAYEVYRIYNALRLHFTTDYDFFKYKGAVRTSASSFNKLPMHEMRAFEKISRLSEPKTYLVGNFLFNESNYIQFFDSKEYLKYRTYLTNGNYIFSEEIKKLKVPYGSNFNVELNSVPYILQLYLNDQISLYSICILDRIFRWSSKIDNPIFQEYIKKINKSRQFFKYDEQSAKRQLIENVNNR